MKYLAPHPAVVIAALLQACAARCQPPGGELWRQGAHYSRHVESATPDIVRIPLAAGEFVRIEAMQMGIDLVVSFRDPAGRPVFDVDSGNGRYGPETVVAIANTPGEYELQVKVGDPREADGEYTVTAVELRKATEADRDVVAAHRNYAGARELLNAGTTEARQRAIDKLQLALTFFRSVDDRYVNGLAAYGVGTAMVRSGDFRSAVPLFDEAAGKFRSAGDQHGEADALNSQGGSFDIMGEPQKALQRYQEALSLFVALGDRRREALLLNNIGLSESRLTRWNDALDHYQQSLRLFRELGDRRLEANVMTLTGVTYQRIGETERARSSLEEALRLQRLAGDKRLEATALDALANLYLARKETAKALQYNAQALPLWRALGDRRGEAQSLIFEGQAYLQSARNSEGVQALLQALDLARAIHDRRLTGEALVYLANGALRTGDGAKAVEWGEQAIAEFHAIGDRAFEARALETVARAESVRGRLPEARQRIEESLRVSEETRLGADSQQLRASFFATRQDAYSFYIDLLMRAGDSEALALETSERARARSLLEMLAAAGTEIREGVDAKLLERQRDLSNLLNAKGARLLPLLGTNDPRVAELTEEIHNLEAEYQDGQAVIRKNSPQYAELSQPRVLTAAQIQRDLLDGDTLLIEYSLGEERSYMWIVGRDELHSYQLPARVTLEDQARRLAQLLAARADAGVAAAARELSAMVFGKAAPELGDKRLLIVPDGGLQRVPFAMLPLPGSDEPLLARHEVVLAPSASALAALRARVAGRKAAPKLLAVFADPVFAASDPRAGGAAGAAAGAGPPAESSRLLTQLAEDDAGPSGSAAGGAVLNIPRLPYTAREAGEILRVAAGRSNLKAVGFDASRATALSGALSEYRFLHFATHGYLDAERPALSALVLSQMDAQHRPVDGFLRVNDIYNARLAADLVSLSACQTGLGKEVRGEGLMGLTRAFLYAGVPRVVVSLWNVNDRATASLMASFYEKMLRGGERPSQALREAQLELRKQKRWSSPYFWAAFVQQGDWQWEGR